jgi:hypothetical protein
MRGPDPADDEPENLVSHDKECPPSPTIPRKHQPMKHELPQLPFAQDALEPHISAETLEYHHGKHHAKYVSKLNDLVPGTAFEEMPLEMIVRKATGKIFNNPVHHLRRRLAVLIATKNPLWFFPERQGRERGNRRRSAFRP